MIIILTNTIVTVAVQQISSTTRAVVATDSVIAGLLTSTIISTTFIDICVIIDNNAVKVFQVSGYRIMVYGIVSMYIVLPWLQEVPVQPALQLHTLGDVHVPWRHDGLQTAADKNSKQNL